MANRRIEMHQHRHVIARLRQGESLRAIARSGLMGRIKAGKVQAIAKEQGWLNPAYPLPDESTLAEVFGTHVVRPAAVSSVARYKELVCAWAKQEVAVSVIYATLARDHGFTGSYSSVRRFVRSLNLKAPKATIIMHFEPGEAAQVDFGTGPKLIAPETGEARKTWFFVMTMAASRHMYVECVFDQKIMTWLGCHKRAFEFFEGVPRKVIIDNLTTAITKACYYDPKVQRSYEELALSYGFCIAPCPVRHPQKKGRVEAGVKYVKGSFMPLRNFKDLADVNKQLRQWNMEIAGNRIHGTTQRQPLTMFAEIEKGALQPLPEHPVELAVWHQAKVHGDCHVQYEKCRYSVPFIHIRKTVWIKATEKMVSFYDEQDLVATHTKGHVPGYVSTIKEHYPPEAQAFLMRDPQWCLTKAEKIGPSCRTVVETLFGNKVLERLRSVQGVLALKSKYGSKRLEKACSRALHYDAVSYGAINAILRKGNDQMPLEIEHELPLEEIYTKEGRFIRQTTDFKQ